MNIIPGKYNLLGCNRKSKARLRASKYDSSKPTKSDKKLDVEEQSERMIKMNKKREKHMKLELFNARKCHKKLNFHTYEIIYNALLYVALSIYCLTIFISFFSCL